MTGEAESTRAVFWGLSMTVIVLIVLSIVGFTLSAAGAIGGTVVEREVFEQSYQRQAGHESKIALMSAEAESLRIRLENPDISSTARVDMEATLAALEIQITAAQSQINQ